ncbi:MAG: acyltransferase [Jannaschia sp.]
MPGGDRRIEAFDGLRGVAAFMVLIYHYFCLAHPRWTASMSTDPRAVVDTPVYLLWNGAFAVALFFVLSGYVMAAAARRRRSSLMANTAARYLRLAVPAAASCVLAWIWLSMVPGAADTMADSVDHTSRWLDFTYQDDVKTPVIALADGMGAVFVRGYSRFNNVLWTMKIELFGSLAVFALYFLTSGRLRLILLGLGTVVLPPLTEPSYIAFGLGAGLYEAHRSGLLARLDRIPALGPVVLLVAVALAFPGDGFHIRESLPRVAEDWQVGEHRGYLHVIAGTLLILAVIQIRALRVLFGLGVAQWLGRMSFSLYLVHVPLLYTFGAWLFVESEVPSPVIAVLFIACSLLLAMVFERFIDRPLIATLPRFRRSFDKRTGLGPAAQS